MNIPILIECIFIIMHMQTVWGDIRDFIISEESDLSRFEDKNVESFDEIDFYDYDSEMDTMNDMCDGAEPSPEYYSSYDLGEFDISVDSFDSIIDHSPDLKRFKQLLSNLAWDPRYAGLIKKINQLEIKQFDPRIESESNSDMYFNYQNEDTN